MFQELREQRMAAVEEQQQRERREREAAVRRKENSSANASSEVKQKLQVNRSDSCTSNYCITTDPPTKKIQRVPKPTCSTVSTLFQCRTLFFIALKLAGWLICGNRVAVQVPSKKLKGRKYSIDSTKES